MPPILFLEKVFFKRRKPETPLRGVELFNLQLVRELGAEGREVLFPMERCWEAPAFDFWGGTVPQGVHVVPAPNLFLPAFGALAGTFSAVRRARRFSSGRPTLLLGNVGNGLIPAIGFLRRTRAMEKMVLIAHREPPARFLPSIARLPGHVVCVCGPIADDFRRVPGLAAEVHVDYGVMNAEAFRPAESGETAPRDGRIRFCVLGALDNAWKGAATAIAAFRLLPDAIRARAELHLVAYRDPPSFPGEPGIRPYGWTPASEIPALLRKMDALLVPSRDEEVIRETFSQATVQGMLTGLPVLYADLPILREKFDEGGGILCASPQDYADAMARLASDPALRARLGAEGRATALRRYVWRTRDFCRRYL